MKDRLNIDGVWYIKEEPSKKQEVIKVDESLLFHGLTNESDKVCFELTVLFDEDGDMLKNMDPSLEVTFKKGERRDWVVDYWDNEDYLLKILNGQVDGEVLELMGKLELSMIKELVNKAVKLGWFREKDKDKNE